MCDDAGRKKSCHFKRKTETHTGRGNGPCSRNRLHYDVRRSLVITTAHVCVYLYVCMCLCVCVWVYVCWCVCSLLTLWDFSSPSLAFTLSPSLAYSTPLTSRIPFPITLFYFYLFRSFSLTHTHTHISCSTSLSKRDSKLVKHNGWFRFVSLFPLKRKYCLRLQFTNTSKAYY